MNNLFVFLATFLITFIFTVIFTKKLIPIIKSKRIGQKILEDGPSWHKPKEGTPTMGGLAFIFAILIALGIYCFLVKNENKWREIICVINVVVYAILNGIIGVVDDIAKIKNKRNKGLTAKKKFFLQSIVSILFLISFKYSSNFPGTIVLPYLVLIVLVISVSVLLHSGYILSISR